MSTIVGTCSMPTGHASTQAMQVVHDHRASSEMSGSAEPLPSPLLLGVLVQAIADVEDHLPRSQRRAGGGRGADVRAAAALGAREGVEHLLPGQVGQRGDPDQTLRRTVERGDPERPARG